MDHLVLVALDLFLEPLQDVHAMNAKLRDWTEEFIAMVRHNHKFENSRKKKNLHVRTTFKIRSRNQSSDVIKTSTDTNAVDQGERFAMTE